MRISVAAPVVLSSLLALTLTSGAHAAGCETFCTPSSNCAAQCIVDPQDWPRVWTTCGAWGVCCQPNWVETGREFRGRFQKEWPLYCEIWEKYDVYQTDTNHCRADRVICDDLFTGDRSWGTNDCCVDHGCWGEQYGC